MEVGAAERRPAAGWQLELAHVALEHLGRALRQRRVEIDRRRRDAAVAYQPAQQVAGRGRRVGAPPEAAGDQAREQAGVVDMGVRQDHRRDVAGRDRQAAIVQRLQALGALEHAAIDEQHPVAGREKIGRAGDGSCRAEKVEGGHRRRPRGVSPSPILRGRLGAGGGAQIGQAAGIASAALAVASGHIAAGMGQRPKRAQEIGADRAVFVHAHRCVASNGGAPACPRMQVRH
jgi:hypothetical protein